MNVKEVFIAAQLGLKAMEEIAYAYFQREEMSFFKVLLLDLSSRASGTFSETKRHCDAIR
jgi:fatty acid-binding protein DegV